MAIIMINTGAHYFGIERYEEAIPFLIQGYGFFQKIGSPSVSDVESFLMAIIERIGKTRFDEIVSKMNES